MKKYTYIRKTLLVRYPNRRPGGRNTMRYLQHNAIIIEEGTHVGIVEDFFETTRLPGP